MTLKNKISFFLLLVLSLPVIMSCDNEDDIDAIFGDRTWRLINFYTTTDWDNDHKTTDEVFDKDSEEYKIIHSGNDRFYIIFQKSGRFEAKGIGSSFQGTWSADGKKNTFTMSVSSNRPGGSSTAAKVEQQFYDDLNKSGFYRGDINTIRIFQSDKKHFMQFAPPK